MNTWEMIKELMENPTKVFVTNDECGPKAEAFVRSGVIKFQYEHGSAMSTIDLKREWEEVKISVDFVEAVRASMAGRPVEARYKNIIISNKGFSIDMMLLQLDKHAKGEKLSEIIADIKWYIED